MKGVGFDRHRLNATGEVPGWERHAWVSSRWCPCTASPPCRPSGQDAQQDVAATSCLLCAEQSAEAQASDPGGQRTRACITESNVHKSQAHQATMRKTPCKEAALKCQSLICPAKTSALQVHQLVSIVLAAPDSGHKVLVVAATMTLHRLAKRVYLISCSLSAKFSAACNATSRGKQSPSLRAC